MNQTSDGRPSNDVSAARRAAGATAPAISTISRWAGSRWSAATVASGSGTVGGGER